MKKIKSLLRNTWKDFKRNKRFLAYTDDKDSEKKLALFRKQCHILDKGINYDKFERGHSRKAYEVAKRMRNELSAKYAKDPSFQWASEVIQNYEKLQEGNTMQHGDNVIQYSEDNRKRIFDFMRSRVSCRNFDGRSIATSVIENIIEMAVDAPNGCCRQTSRFHFTQNIEKINSLLPNIAGMTCFSNIPCVMFVTAFEKPYKIIDKNLPYVDASLAAENLILAARAYNIFGTMCNCFQMSREQENSVRNIMKIHDDEVIVLCIALGYPTKVPKKPARMNVDVFINEIL